MMLTAAFAAIYAVLVFTLAGVSFGIVQVRIADALIPLSIIFGWPAVCGVTLGCVIANVFTPFPSIFTDITLGSVANFAASLLAWKIGSWKPGRVGELLGCIAAAIVVTFIVGTYLAMITATGYLVWWTGVGIGSIISICIVGFLLVSILGNSKIRVTLSDLHH